MKDRTIYERRIKSLEPGSFYWHSAFASDLKPSHVISATDRLLSEGRIRRLDNDLFFTVPEGGGFPPPSSLISFLRRCGERIVMRGDQEAEFYNLAVREDLSERVFLSDGPSRSWRLGKMSVALLHSEKWLLKSGIEGIITRIVYHFGANREIMLGLVRHGRRDALRSLAFDPCMPESVRTFIIETIGEG